MKKVTLIGMAICVFTAISAQSTNDKKATTKTSSNQSSDTTLPKKIMSDSAKVVKDGGGFKVGQIQKTSSVKTPAGTSNKFLPTPGKEATSLKGSDETKLKKGWK